MPHDAQVLALQHVAGDAPSKRVPWSALGRRGRAWPTRGASTRPPAALLGAAGTLISVWLLLPHAETADDLVIAGCVAAMYLAALVLLLVPTASSRRDTFAHGGVMVGAVLTSVVIVLSGVAASGLAFLYVWFVPYAFAAFRLRAAAVHAAFIALLFAGVLVLISDQAAPGHALSRWSLAVGTVVTVGVFVRRLTRSEARTSELFRRGFDESGVGMALLEPSGTFVRVNEAFGRMLDRRPQELVGVHLSAIGHPDDLGIAAGNFEAALRADCPPALFAKRCLRRDGEVVWTQLALSGVADGDAKFVLAQAQDVTEQRQAERDLARRDAEHRALADLGQRGLESDDLDALMSSAVDLLAEVLAVNLTKVLRAEPDGRMRMIAGRGWRPGSVGRATVPDSEESQAGYTIATAEPVIVEDNATETRFTSPDLLLDHDVVSGMSVIIGSRERPYGVLGVHTSVRRNFTGDDANFLRSMAAILGAAVARHASEATIRHEALHDPLTGLPNRRYFLERVAAALGAGEDAAVAVLLVDLDHFKFVNDSFGHDLGDELLTRIAPALRRAVRPSDTVARLGGDEFAIVCPGLDDHEAREVAGRLRAACGPSVQLSRAEVAVSASIGIAVGRGSSTDALALLREADSALYRAKDRGRGHAAVFDEPMRTAAVERLRMENDLRRAVAEGELRLAYQPLVSVASGELYGFEALLRWEHARRGSVSPAQFIPLAEESGLIVPIGEWVLAEASRQVARWQKVPGAESLRISVNVSGRQLSDPAFADVVARVLASTGLAPGTLDLEVTESVLMEAAELPMSTLLQLKHHGARLLLDDFGTGYSSLSYLKRLPLDVVKIDRSFVQGIDTSRDDAAIVAAIVTMARTLGLSVVGEGVETDAQLEALRRLGCDGAQGYLLGRPQDAATAERLLAGLHGRPRLLRAVS